MLAAYNQGALQVKELADAMLWICRDNVSLKMFRSLSAGRF